MRALRERADVEPATRACLSRGDRDKEKDRDKDKDAGARPGCSAKMLAPKEVMPCPSIKEAVIAARSALKLIWTLRRARIVATVQYVGGTGFGQQWRNLKVSAYWLVGKT